VVWQLQSAMAGAAPLDSIQDFWGSRRSGRSFRGGSSRNWGIGPDNVFGRNSALSRRDEADDEEALKWAALEKLPTMDRLHTTILQKRMGSRIVHEEVDVRRMGFVERQQIIDGLLKVTEEDNERFLKKLRARIDRYETIPLLKCSHLIRRTHHQTLLYINWPF
jgi:hypothetical protein